MTRAHYVAIRDRLATLTASGKLIPATLGDPPWNQSLPYTFITPRPSVKRSESVASVRNLLDETFNITLVHSSANNVLALSEVGSALLDEWTPEVDGWHTYPLELIDAQPVQTSTTVVDGTKNTYPRWAVLQFRLRASKE